MVLVPSKFGVVNVYPQTKEFRIKTLKSQAQTRTYSYTCSDRCSVNLEIKKTNKLKFNKRILDQIKVEFLPRRKVPSKFGRV